MDIMKLIVAFRNFANAPKNETVIRFNHFCFNNKLISNFFQLDEHGLND
jgi:hypothetical protein